MQTFKGHLPSCGSNNWVTSATGVMSLYWFYVFVFINLAQTTVIWEEETPVEKMPQSDQAVLQD